jgi:dipeptidase D
MLKKREKQLLDFLLSSNRVIEIFKELSTIPHCSSNTKELYTYIVSFAKKHNYKIEFDDTYNILCSMENPKICFQAHYDMVCIDAEFPLKLLIEDDCMSAIGSSLGADNGIGCAIMLALIELHYSGEFLFTNDEEIGLIGANALNIPIISKYLLNLDSESEGDVYIGCAGGFDIDVEIINEKSSVKKNIYNVSTVGFKGGHSGVDIEKGINNAIIDSIDYINKHDCVMHSINGGERRNAIPRDVECIVSSDTKINWELHSNFSAKKIDLCKSEFSLEKIQKLLLPFSDGVRAWDSNNDVPRKSVNTALIKSDGNKSNIVFTARANTKDDFRILKQELVQYFQLFNVKINMSSGYQPWDPEETDFSKLVLEKSKIYFPKANYKVIHAGLECAVLKEKIEKIDAVSMGPNIFFPHSNREYVELSSVNNICKILEEVISNV